MAYISDSDDGDNAKIVFSILKTNTKDKCLLTYQSVKKLKFSMCRGILIMRGSETFFP